MQTAAVRRDTVPQTRYLFEAAVASRDGRAAMAAVAASLLLHVPLLPLLGLWAPDPVHRTRERDVTAVFNALLEEERIVPVDLESLCGGSGASGSGVSGPAGGSVRLTDTARARGDISDSVQQLMHIANKTTDRSRSGGAAPSPPVS